MLAVMYFEQLRRITLGLKIVPVLKELQECQCNLP